MISNPLNARHWRASALPRRAKRSFTLLEVIVAMTILMFTITAILRSFSQSLSAIRQLEVRTQAGFFAQQLLDEFEIDPPDEGVHEGGFGDDYAAYYYQVEVVYEMPEYREYNRHRSIEQFFPLRRFTIEIFYDDGYRKPIRALSIDSAIMGFERFAEEAKIQYGNF